MYKSIFEISQAQKAKADKYLNKVKTLYQYSNTFPNPAPIRTHIENLIKSGIGKFEGHERVDKTNLRKDFKEWLRLVNYGNIFNTSSPDYKEYAALVKKLDINERNINPEGGKPTSLRNDLPSNTDTHLINKLGIGAEGFYITMNPEIWYKDLDGHEHIWRLNRTEAEFAKSVE